MWFRIAGAAAIAAASLSVAMPLAAQPRPPSGSYLRSCEQVYVDRGVIVGQCRTRDGAWRDTRLRLDDCGPGDIYNNDGYLGCAPPRGMRSGPPPDYGYREPPPPGYGQRPPPPPPGYGYQQQRSYGAVVFEDSGFRGEALQIEGDVGNFSDVRFNDRISSMRLGNARWQVCTDAHFRGRCTVMSGDVYNLDRTGFNDAISSMRRVR